MSDPQAGPSSPRASAVMKGGAAEGEGEAPPLFKKRNRKGPAGKIRIGDGDATNGKRVVDGGENGEEGGQAADVEGAAGQDEEQA